MSTLRREALEIVEGILIHAYSDNPQTQDAIDYAREQAEKIVDKLLELRGFSFLATDEEQQPYNIEEADVAWSMLANKPITQKQVNKQAETFEFETMIDVQLARLPLNWRGFRDQDKENFRKFLKNERKEYGRELEVFINWWMSDERRVANPPWKLETIKIKWLEAFKNASKPVAEVKTDANDAPISYS